MTDLNNVIIKSVNGAFTVFSEPDRIDKIQNRTYYGLSLCTNGFLIYEQNGKIYKSHKNNIILLPKGGNYLVHRTVQGVFPLIDFDMENYNSDEIQTFDINNNEVFIEIFNKIRNLILYKDKNLEIMSLMYSILNNIEIQKANDNTLLPVIKYIEKNYSNSKLNNLMLAKVCNISEVYLRKLFLKQYNTSPKQFVIDIRITKSKQLLSEGFYSIEAISEKCGFSNLCHFCRIFKNKVGLTPGEYMKNNKPFGEFTE